MKASPTSCASTSGLLGGGCRPVAALLAIVCFAGAVGCSSMGGGGDEVYEVIDVAVAAKARWAFREGVRRGLQDDPDFPEVDGEGIDWHKVDRESEADFGDVLLAELIAIVPGAIVPGLGHYYAGDYRTSAQLRRVGGLGIALTAVGGGLIVGGHFLDEEEDVPDGYAYGLYGSGGTVGVLGLAYYLTGWIYDIVDTPRAVLSGGKPPPRNDFVDSLDFFGR